VVAQNVKAVSSQVQVAINRKHRGSFALTSALRPETEAMLDAISRERELVLLSGDNEKEREKFTALFKGSSQIHFNQTPQKKLDYIGELQKSGKTVMMVGDGLNDAGALKSADIGVAVVENISAFSPASDVIMSANMVPRLHEVLRFSKATVRVVKLSFIVSSVYNVVGISIAASGKLSPVVCAILMPLSSVTVVALGSGMTAWFGRRVFKNRSSREKSPAISKNEMSLRPSVTVEIGGAA